MTSLLELAADLERRDAAVAVEADRVGRLADGAKAIAKRLEAISALLDGAPAEHAVIDRTEADARALRSAAEADLGATEALVARLETAARVGHDLADARRDVAHAREGLCDASVRVQRVALRRVKLTESEGAARECVPELVAQAHAVAGQLADLPRVSASGRLPPEATLAGVGEWAARVHLALLVVRGQLDIERDRLVREANELGSIVLGEELAGNSVQLVGKRVRTMLAG